MSKSPKSGAPAAEGEPPLQSRPEYYDTELNLKLIEATERYRAATGDLPTPEQKRAFVFDGVDFSRDY